MHDGTNFKENINLAQQNPLLKIFLDNSDRLNTAVLEMSQ